MTTAPKALDFLLDDGDEEVIVNGDYVLATDAAGIRQLVSIKIRFFLGEWFADRAKGIPYFEAILVKNPRPIEVREVFSKAIASVPGIREVLSVSLEDQGNREAILSWEAVADIGLLSGQTAVRTA